MAALTEVEAAYTIGQDFWEKVIVNGECWEWIGAISDKGYGTVTICGKTFLCHRIAFILQHGQLVNGLLVLHQCDNRRCVRGKHLFPGTQSDNMKDASAKGRLFNPNTIKTHCPQGHAYDSENTRITIRKSGAAYRSCKSCHAAKERVRRAGYVRG